MVKEVPKAQYEQSRSGKKLVDMNLSKSTTITVQQKDFLANERNKTRLIHLLTQKMRATGIDTIIVVTGDVDATIVRCVLDKVVVHPTVAIVIEDVDNVVFVGLAPPSGSNIYFMKPGRGKIET